jgi:hypothetical protein
MKVRRSLGVVLNLPIASNSGPAPRKDEWSCRERARREAMAPLNAR